eukprot:8273665-Alexandrium_andersonii.AAC.1
MPAAIFAKTLAPPIRVLNSRGFDCDGSPQWRAIAIVVRVVIAVLIPLAIAISGVLAIVGRMGPQLTALASAIT